MTRLGALAVVVAALAAAAPASADRYVAGAPGAGDPFFPNAGNGGYDVGHYSLDLDYDQPANRLDGKVKINARATQGLSSFNLDLRDFLTVARVTVNGARASFTHAGQELSITPAAQAQARAAASWSASPTGACRSRSSTPTSRSRAGSPTRTDGAFVVNEPQGAPGWFPVNDTPRDKATYDFRITVPAGHTALANGRLLSKRTRHGRTTWRWAEDSPMSSYLVTATNGPFQTRFDRLPNGLPQYNAVDPDTRESESDPPDPDLAWRAPGRPAGDHLFLLRALRPLRLQQRGLDRRLGAERRLRARVADQAQLRPHPRRGDARPRARAPVVRRRGHARDLARRLAERGLRHLVRMDLRRAPRRRPGLGPVRRTCARFRRAARKARTSGSRLRPPWRARISCSARPCTRAAR